MLYEVITFSKEEMLIHAAVDERRDIKSTARITAQYADSVITSYSIHYTKLYEFDVRTPEAFLGSAAHLQNEEAARMLIGLFFTAVETGDEVALRYPALAASHAADCSV